MLTRIFAENYNTTVDQNSITFNCSRAVPYNKIKLVQSSITNTFYNIESRIS